MIQRLKQCVSDWRNYVPTVSMGFNFFFLILLFFWEYRNRGFSYNLHPKSSCYESVKFNDLSHIETCLEADFLQRMSEYGESTLTHVVMPYHPRQENLVMENLKLWSSFRPCAKRTNVTFVFFPASAPNLDTELRLISAFRQMDQCFQDVAVKFADLGEWNDSYLMGTRLQFEQLFDIPGAKTIFYMEPDARPIRSLWLEQLRMMSASSLEPFWVKGSIFRGKDLSGAFHPGTLYTPHNLLHINGNALYKVDDPAFRSFYFDIIRIIISAYEPSSAYDTDFAKVLVMRPQIWHLTQKH